jgi:glycosyltransferase involved in cell wall biosynthesis
VVILEALTAGKPVVASRIDGYAELLEPTGAARLVPAGNEHALAEELTRVLLDDELRSTLGRRGVAAAAAYDWGRLALRLDDVYVRLLEERRRRLSHVSPGARSHRE